MIQPPHEVSVIRAQNVDDLTSPSPLAKLRLDNGSQLYLYVSRLHNSFASAA